MTISFSVAKHPHETKKTNMVEPERPPQKPPPALNLQAPAKSTGRKHVRLAGFRMVRLVS